MEITFNELKSKEIINIYDGKKLGRAIDLIFNKDVGEVLGIVVPGAQYIFKKSEEIFIPINSVKKIGDDVILVKLSPANNENNIYNQEKNYTENIGGRMGNSTHYKRVPEKEK